MIGPGIEPLPETWKHAPVVFEWFGDYAYLQMKRANVGVGKLHHSYELRLYLLDGKGKPVLSAEAKADPRDWLPGEHSVSESLSIPATLKPGDYVVALALIDPSAQHRPWRLAIDAPSNEGRYEISKVNVE